MEVLPLQPFNLTTACRLRFLFLVFTMLILRIAPSSGACQEELFKCGTYLFGYPFGSKNSGCGDPALQLDCDHQVQKPLLNISDYKEEMPLLNISGYQYYIHSPSEYFWPSNHLESDSSHTMNIIDKNLWEGKCNPLSSKITAQFWSSPQFHFAGDYENVTVFQQCSPEITGDLSSLPCNYSWYYNTSNFYSLESKCELQAVLPVRKVGGPIQDRILLHGLKIEWNVSKNCTECDSNGGHCAYNKSSMQFCCECSGKWCANKCPSVAGKSKNKFIIIGCSVGGAAVVAAAVIFHNLYAKRRKSLPTLGLGTDFSNYHRSDMKAYRPRYTIGSLAIFPYQELQQATNFFDEDNELGDGGFGAVYLGKLQDGRIVAVKRLFHENSRRVEQFINEVQILSSLCHPNLVRLYGCTLPESPMLLLVYEFVPNGTLFDHLHGSRRSLRGLPWETRLNIAIETAQALAYLHSIDPPIFHRDVKSGNILLDENYRAKVADFGLSRLVPGNVTHVTTAPQGTPGYVDPEYHQRFQLTDKSDVYSFGVVLVELISAKVAVDTSRSNNEISLAYMAIDKIRAGAVAELVDPDLKMEKNHEVKVMVGAVAELAFECLAREREFRPGMKEVVYRLEQIKRLMNVTPTDSPISGQEQRPMLTV